MDNNTDVVYISTKPDGFGKDSYKSVFTRLGVALILEILCSMYLSRIFIIFLNMTGIFSLLDETGLYIAQWVINDIFAYVIPIALLWFLLRDFIKQNSKEKPKFNYAMLLLYLPAMVFIGMLGSVLTQYFTDFLNWLFGTGELKDALQSVTPTSNEKAWLFLLFVGIIAPIAEEIIYRGMILRGLLPFGEWLAVGLSSVIFGLIHGNLDQFAYSAFVGVILGIVTVKSNSIIPSIFLHATNNFMVSLLNKSQYLYSGNDVPTLFDNILDIIKTGWTLFCGACYYFGILAVFALIFYKGFTLKKANSTLSPRERLKLTIINPAFLIAIVLLCWRTFSNSFI